MTEPRETVDRLAAEAAEIESIDARAAFLDVACAGDTVMRAAVDAAAAALDADRATTLGGFAHAPMDVGFARGDTVGRYRLIERLG